MLWLKDNMDLIAPLLFALILTLVVYIVMGLTPTLVIGGAAFCGLLMYLKTSFRAHFDTMKVIVPYLMSVVFFIIHVYEEYVFGFEKVVAALNGHPFTQFKLLTMAGFLAPAAWIIGAILIIKRWALGYYFLAFFFVAMTVAELTHFIFPFILYGHFTYTAGVYTAALPLIPAWYGLYVTIQETRKIRQAKREDKERQALASEVQPQPTQ